MNARRPQCSAACAPRDERLTESPPQRLRLWCYVIERHALPRIVITTLKRQRMAGFTQADQLIERADGTRQLIVAAEVAGVTETEREVTFEPIH
jgi:hypothetical protein